ncbi:Metallo-beta-lactamase superfamily protein [Mycena venus]|uniref:Metallo-beta-lactamase superfamily protein n=1 Tax=Mycena venus TaxID=2733690 RepID=A0A8H7D2M9_9AGAR|nr:Metallo-beta-lactamase superfamily protein [Mycena venus]
MFVGLVSELPRPASALHLLFFLLTVWDCLFTVSAEFVGEQFSASHVLVHCIPRPEISTGHSIYLNKARLASVRPHQPSMRLLSSLSFLLVVRETYASWLDFGIPPSSETVDVRVFNVANGTVVNAANTLISPILPGRESIAVPIFAFLVEHKRSRFMFDLGFRTDPLNFAPSVASLFTTGVIQLEEPFKGITELLQDGGIPLDSIDAVIWSHSHFDHIGDMSKFPNTTELIIGSETDTQTFPDFPNATLQTSDLAGRQVTKIDFAAANLTFSGLKAIDYFGDGSFYLLNTPGHLPGHMTALARVTPTSFIGLGGDTFHHVGEARPRPSVSEELPLSCASFRGGKDVHIDRLFLQLLAVSDQPNSFYADPVTSQVSLEKIATFDADPDIWVLVAHDMSLRDVIPYYPAYSERLESEQFEGEDSVELC